MIRPVFTEIALFLLPFLVYAVFLWATRAGVLAYWAEGVRQIIRYDFPEIRIHSAGQERRATLVVVGRTVNYGGPFKITTGANLFEDSFEILTNAASSRFRYIACLPALWLGKLQAELIVIDIRVEPESSEALIEVHGIYKDHRAFRHYHGHRPPPEGF